MNNKLITLTNQSYIFIGGMKHGEVVGVREAAALDQEKYIIYQKYFNDKRFKVKIPFIVEAKFDLSLLDEDSEFSQLLNSYGLGVFNQKRNESIDFIVGRYIEKNICAMD